MTYFPLLYRLQGEERYLIWVSNEEDSVVVDANGFVPSFRDLITLHQYAEANHYSLESEAPVRHDLDWVAAWGKSPAAPVDCVEALSAWNLFRDVAMSIPSKGTAFEKLDSPGLPIYDKLFWGNNLPAVTPPGKRYNPEWSPDEIRSLVEILTAGLNLFVSRVRDWRPSNDPSPGEPGLRSG